MNLSLPGRLFYIVGASGAGKDSLIHAAAGYANKQDKLIVAPRVVTRTQQQSEHDVALDERTFLKRVHSGVFLFYWQAHGFHYGIEKSILKQVYAGNIVLVNGSRAYIADVRRIYPATVIVGVKADQDQLQERLLKRGRENQADIDERLERNRLYNQELELADRVIDNDQPLEQAALALLSLVREPS